jgi:hypothetical protein
MRSWNLFRLMHFIYDEYSVNVNTRSAVSDELFVPYCSTQRSSFRGGSRTDYAPYNTITDAKTPMKLMKCAYNGIFKSLNGIRHFERTTENRDRGTPWNQDIYIPRIICSVWKYYLFITTDHLCGLVVRVPGYRSRCPGTIPGTTRFSEK